MSFPVMTSATFPENWPSGLTELAPDTVSLRLSPQDARVLGRFTPGFQCGPAVEGIADPDWFSDALLAAISKALHRFDMGIMPRLSYCSWKGSTLVHAPCRDLTDVLAILTRPDQRIAAALEVMLASDDPVWLHLRHWQDIPHWAEFRMFLRKRQFVGVSQYLHRHVFDELADHYGPLANSIAAFADRVLEEMHIDDAVVDFFMPQTAPPFTPILIELNPFDRRTDPCLFDWDDPNGFDYSFRVRLRRPFPTGFSPAPQAE